jgi:hypothetical protein
VRLDDPGDLLRVAGHLQRDPVIRELGLDAGVHEAGVDDAVATVAATKA